MKFTPERQEALLEFLRNDMPINASCALAGVGRDTYYSWIERGNLAIKRKVYNRYRNFKEEAEKAICFSMQQNLLNIRNAAKDPKQWTASAWILERRHRKEFGKDAELFEAMMKQIDEIKRRLDKRDGLEEKADIMTGVI